MKYGLKEFKKSPGDMENKSFVGGQVTEVKEEDQNGIKVGIIEGYIATWDLDRGNGWIQDQFVKGCFRESIRDHKKRGRQLRFKDHHGRTIGGFLPESLKEDSKGLFGIGQINLEVQQGAEAYSLAKQGVLTDFSVGFSVKKSTRDEQNDIRTITKAILWEGSIVDEPMNPEANITNVKTQGTDDMDEITEEEVKTFTKRDLEDALRKGREFTKAAAKTVASLFEGVETEEEKSTREAKEAQDILDTEAEQEEKGMEKIRDELKSITESVKEKA